MEWDGGSKVLPSLNFVFSYSYGKMKIAERMKKKSFHIVKNSYYENSVIHTNAVNRVFGSDCSLALAIYSFVPHGFASLTALNIWK